MNKEKFIHLSYDETTVCIDHEKRVIGIDTQKKINSHFITNFIERLKNIDGTNFLELADYEYDFN